MARESRDALIGRCRRMLVHASNISVNLKIRGVELRALFAELDERAVEVERLNTELVAEVRRRAEAEALAADALASNVNIPDKPASKTRGKTKPKVVEVVPPVFPALLRAFADINVAYAECWEQPPEAAVKMWADYQESGDLLPVGWEKTLADALGGSP